jgi:putative phosphoribosyl transferase
VRFDFFAEVFMQFMDRADAGRQLATRLCSWKKHKPVVLALPRGGVSVGFEIGRELQAPLDLVIVRKIGAPDQPELALGAVADGEPPEFAINDRLVARLRISRQSLEEAKAGAVAELVRRRSAYLAGRARPSVQGRPALVVDDGIATGATMLAALRVTRLREPSRLVLAVPVAPLQTLERLGRVADEVVCLYSPENFVSVGEFYEAFPQLQDEDVLALLDAAKAFSSDAPPTVQA